MNKNTICLWFDKDAEVAANFHAATFPDSVVKAVHRAIGDQAETDRYWNAIIGNDGAPSECGWCEDKWGINWQITPRVLTEAIATGGDVAKRAFEVMMTMRKIDVAAI
jgi:predicted 3-demethylubiquinone-9 3-methyltransferase (glyoxalase superfamily)